MSPLLPPVWLIAALLPVAAITLAAGWWARAQPGRPARHWDVLALALVGGLVVLFFWRPLLTADVYLPTGGGDLASFFYPLYTFIHRSVQETGQLPLWNPYAFSGAPLAADVQSGLWYPPNWLVWYGLPVPDFGANFVGDLHRTYAVIEWQVILHYLWAALGMYVWLRDLRLLRLAALAGTAAFAFCGFMAAHFGHMPMIFAAAWLSWNLLLTRRVVGGRSWGYTLLLGVTLGLTFLAGHPQTFLYEALAVALYWGWLEWERREPGWNVPPRLSRGQTWRAWLAAPMTGRLLRPLVAGAIAAGLGMVQFLPSNELAAQSVRASISWEEAGQFALQPVGLLGLVLPRVFGPNPTSYWVPWQSTETWGYLGVVALLLAGLALALRRDRITGFAAVLGALALLLSLGPFTDLFAILHGLTPGFDRFRGAGRFLLEVGLATGLLAALGLDRLVRWVGVGGWALGVGNDEGVRGQGSVLSMENGHPQQPEQSETTPHSTPRPGVAREAQTILVSSPPALLTPPSQPLTPHPQPPIKWALWGLTALTAVLVLFVGPLFNALFLSGVSMERAALVLNDLNIGILWVALVTGLLWLAARRRIGATALGLLLAGLLVADLFAPNAAFNPTTTDLTAGYQNANLIGLLYNKGTGRGTTARIDSDTGQVITVWQPATGVLMKIPDAGGLYNPLTLQRYDRVWQRIKTPLQTAPDGVKDNRNSVWYDLLNIRYTIAISEDRPIGVKFHEVDSDAQGVRLYENANMMPRAFVVHDAVVVPGAEEQFAKIDRLDVDPRHTVVLPDGTAAPSGTKGSAEGNPADQARITQYTPNRLELTVANAEPGWLVLSEVWYPGWTATLDGAPAPIIQADYLLRAVQVGPGTHTLVMEFRSRPLLIGQIISGVTALLVGLAGLSLALWGWRQRRARSAL